MRAIKFIVGWLKCIARLMHLPVACASIVLLSSGCGSVRGDGPSVAQVDLDVASARFVQPREVVTNLTDVTYIFMPKQHLQILLEICND